MASVVFFSWPERRVTLLYKSLTKRGRPSARPRQHSWPLRTEEVNSVSPSSPRLEPCLVRTVSSFMEYMSTNHHNMLSCKSFSSFLRQLPKVEIDKTPLPRLSMDHRYILTHESPLNLPQRYRPTNRRSRARRFIPLIDPR